MNADRTLFAGRLIALSLLLGVLLYAAVAAWLLGSGTLAPLDPEAGRILVWAWGAVSVACAFGWIAFRRRALELLRAAAPGRDGAEGPGRAFALLIVTWALAEAIGIAGVTAGLWTGRAGPRLLGPLATAIGVAGAWPRDEWFPAIRSRTPDTEGGGS